LEYNIPKTVDAMTGLLLFWTGWVAPFLLQASSLPAILLWTPMS